MVSLDDIEEESVPIEWKALGFEQEWNSPPLELRIKHNNKVKIDSARRLNPELEEIGNTSLLGFMRGKKVVNCEWATYKLLKSSKHHYTYQLEGETADAQRAIYKQIQASIETFRRSEKSNPILCTSGCYDLDD